MSSTLTLVAGDNEDLSKPSGALFNTKFAIAARHKSSNKVKKPFPAKVRQFKRGGIRAPRNSVYRASKGDEGVSNGNNPGSQLP